MNTVDLSKAKAGDVVHFRCGGSTEIEYSYDEHINGIKCYCLYFGNDNGCALNYENDGHVCGLSPIFDIVKVESK